MRASQPGVAYNRPVAPPRVLFIRLGAIGDVVRTLPALRLVREHLPQARLCWVVEERSSPVLEGHSDLDEVMVLQRGALGAEISRPDTFFAGLGRLGRFAKDLRRRNFSASLDFQGTLKSGLVALAAAAPRRIGYDRASVKEWNHLFNTERITLPPPPVHRVARNLALLASLGIRPDTQPLTTQLPIQDTDRAGADAALGEVHHRGRPFVFVYPGSSARQAYKRYPAACYRDIVGRLLAAGVEVVVGQGPGEEEIAHALVPAAGPRPVVLPPTPLLVMAEVIRRARLFLGGDTGPMHLAWIQGVRVLALFGPTDPALNAPWGDGHVVFDALASELEGSGGRGILRGRPASRPRDPSLFDSLDPASIAAAALAMVTSDSMGSPLSHVGARPGEGGSVETGSTGAWTSAVHAS